MIRIPIAPQVYMSIKLEEGKYEFYMNSGLLFCRRHGQEWREFVGDKAVSALYEKCEELQKQLDELKNGPVS